MKFEELLKLEEWTDSCPNYQHKGKSLSQITEMANASFSRLAPNDQAVVLGSWSRLKLNPEVCKRLRFKAQTNLYFLCRLLEKYKDISDYRQTYILNGEEHNTHEEICNLFFERKDPTFKNFEAFAKSKPDKKEKLLLVPRGGFKSSIDMADCVQWVVCFPEVTILILTGVLQLARDFVGEIRQHFTLEETGIIDANDKMVYGPRTMNDGTPSMFQILFPEHCTRPDDGKQTEFMSPACKMRDKEPTIMAASIEQNLSGWHYGIMKLDDVVTNENSLTITRMEAVNKQASVNKAMLHPFGFIEYIGTWYDEADLYGVKIKYEEKLKEEGEESTTNIYLRSAWWPNEESIKLGRIEAEMTEKDYILWFPERLPYKFLSKEKKMDPDGFAIKYENDPRKVHQVKFPRELLIRRTIPAYQLPQQGMIVTTVDTAYSTKNFADYTVIMTSLIFGGRFYVIDMSRGRFNEFELPTMIAATGFKWKPKRIAIEDSVGVRWLDREIKREMQKLNISIPIEYVSLGLGTKAKSKEIKAKPVLRLLGDERLFFANSMNGLEELYNELEKFPKGTHDDIVSGLSILVDQFAAYADMEARLSSTQQNYVADQKSKEMHDMLYGLGRYAQHNINFQLTENNIIDKMDRGIQEIPERDPLSDLF